MCSIHDSPTSCLVSSETMETILGMGMVCMPISRVFAVGLSNDTAAMAAQTATPVAASSLADVAWRAANDLARKGEVSHFGPVNPQQVAHTPLALFANTVRETLTLKQT